MRQLLVPFLLLLALPSIATAQERGRSLGESVRPAYQSRVASADSLTSEPTRQLATGRIGVRSGAWRADYRAPRVQRQRTRAATARRLIDRHGARYGLRGTSVALEQVRESTAGTHVTFRQEVRGVPIYGARVKVNIGANGDPAMVYSSAVSVETGGWQIRPAISATRARRAAKAAFEAERIKVAEPQLYFLPDGTLVWQMLLWTASPIGEWNVLLDAQSGEVIFLQERTLALHGDEAPPQKIDGSGLAFRLDPLSEAGVTYGGPFVDATDGDTAQVNAQRVEVPLQGIRSGSDGLFLLEGPYVAITGDDGTGGSTYVPPAESDPNGFRYTRSEVHFEAVNAYHHVDASRRYVDALDVAFPDGAPVRLNPHATSADVSYYLPGQDIILMGDGGVDDAEDGGVIRHEYAHALLERAAPGLLSSAEGRALHEGWADYWAVSFQRALVESGQIARTDWRRLFLWDTGWNGSNGRFWSGRVVDRAGVYPDDFGCDDSENCSIYDDGLIWATTLMEVQERLGRTVSDRLVVASLSYLMSPTTFTDAAHAVIQADRDLYGGAHAGDLVEAFEQRGFVQSSDYGPVLQHDPLLASEELGGTATVEAKAYASGEPMGLVRVIYGTGETLSDTLDLEPAGDDLVRGELPLPVEADTLRYFIEAVDLSGLRDLLPAGAPAATYAVPIGPDETPPVAEHDPEEQVAYADWPARLQVRAYDPIGIDTVRVNYTLESDGALVSEGVFPLVDDGDSLYAGTFPVSREEIGAGSQITYSVEVIDRAERRNVRRLPESGTYALEVVVEGQLRRYDLERDAPRFARQTGTWQVGPPTYGLHVAREGANVIATYPDRAYPDVGSLSILELEPIGLDGLEEAYLVFWHWYDLEASDLVEPEDSSNAALWDGAQVQVSTDGGASWSPLYPEGGYNGRVPEDGTSALAGEPAFGGYSYGWQRVVMPLPTAPGVRVRFVMATDAENSEATAHQYAGWYLDEIEITTDRPVASGAPVVLIEPEPLRVVGQEQRDDLPVALQLQDDAGVGRVELIYQGAATGRVRLGMSPYNRQLFEGVIPPVEGWAAGDVIEFEVRAEDVDGQVLRLPEGGGYYRIERRYIQRTSAMQNVQVAGGWRSRENGWRVEAPSATERRAVLVTEPHTLPANAATAALQVVHEGELGVGEGANIKISTESGSWRPLEPEGGYVTEYYSEGEHPMLGEQVLRGALEGTLRFDLSAYAGETVRLRFDFASSSSVPSNAYWQVQSADFEVTGVDGPLAAGGELALHPVFPNPLDQPALLSFTIPQAGEVTLEAYDVLGRRVTSLLRGAGFDAGTHSVTLDPTGWAAGVYLIVLRSGGRQQAQRLVVL